MRIDEYTHREVPQSSGLGSANIREPEQLRMRDFSGVESAIKGISRVGGMYAGVLDAKEKVKSGGFFDALDEYNKRMKAAKDEVDTKTEDVLVEYAIREVNARKVALETNNKGTNAKGNTDRLLEASNEIYDKYISADEKNPINGLWLNPDRKSSFGVKFQKRLTSPLNDAYKNEATTVYAAGQNIILEGANDALRSISDPKSVVSVEEGIETYKNHMDSYHYGDPGKRDEAVNKNVPLALKARILTDSNINPMGSYAELRAYSKLLPQEMTEELKGKLLTSAKNYQIDQYAKIRNGEFGLPLDKEWYEENKEFFGADWDVFNRETYDSGQKKADETKRYRLQNEERIINEHTVELLEAQKYGNQEKVVANAKVLSSTTLGQQRLSTLSSTKDDEAALMVAYDYRKNIDNPLYLIQKYNLSEDQLENNQIWAESIIKSEQNKMAGSFDYFYKVRSDIMGGRITRIEDIDMSQMSSAHRSEILDVMVQKQYTDSVLKDIEFKKGTSYRNKISEMFKKRYGTNTQPYLYGMFENSMARKMFYFMSDNNNRLPTEKEFEQMGYDVWSEITGDSEFSNLMNGLIPLTSTENGKYVIHEKQKEQVMGVLEDVFGSYDKETKALYDAATESIMKYYDIEAVVQLFRDWDKR